MKILKFQVTQNQLNLFIEMLEKILYWINLEIKITFIKKIKFYENYLKFEKKS